MLVFPFNRITRVVRRRKQSGRRQKMLLEHSSLLGGLTATSRGTLRVRLGSGLRPQIETKLRGDYAGWNKVSTARTDVGGSGSSRWQRWTINDSAYVMTVGNVRFRRANETLVRDRLTAQKQSRMRSPMAASTTRPPLRYGRR